MKYLISSFLIFFLIFLVPLDVNAEPVTILPTDDAFVIADLHYEDDPSNLRQTNTGNQDFLKVWYAIDVNEAQNQIVSPSYLKFDLADFDVDEINSATLRIHANQVFTTSESPVVGIYNTSHTKWTESDIIFNTAPQIIDIVGVIQIPSVGWYTLDVTTFVQDNAGEQISLALFFPELIQNTEINVEFSSKESENSSYIVINTIADEIIQPEKINIIKISPSDDAFALGDLSNPDKNDAISQINTGNAEYIRTGYSLNSTNNEDLVAVSFLKFNLDELEATNVHTALLKLKTSALSIQQEQFLVGLLPVTDNQWSESELTFANKPDVLSDGIFAPISAADKWYMWDVSELIKENSGPEVSVALMPLARSDGFYEVVEFHSNQSVDVESQPYLEVSIIESSEGGGCLIATATFDSEMAPQVQLLRELRDNTILNTASGTAFMASFNQFYYSFSPYVADYERENPLFKEAVKLGITPMLSSLSILSVVDIDSEEKMLGFGIGVILINIGMYLVAPAMILVGIKKLRSKI